MNSARHTICILGVLLITACVAGKPKKTDLEAADPTAFLFTYFTKNGEDGLHLAASIDGYRWHKVPRTKDYWKSAVGESKLMRDPSVVQGPDGTYHMVWTSGWNENNIGYASTKDFITWSAQQELPVMAHEPNVRNSWAPEVVFDDTQHEFVIYWSSTILGRFSETQEASEDNYNHRLYYTTTRNFKTFAPTKLLYDPGFSVIDATFLTFDNRLYLIVKDETRFPPKKYLQVALAKSFTGPFENLSAPITPEGLWVEGPAGAQVGEEAIIFYDAYTARRYGALRSTDMVTWQDISAMMHFPDEGTPDRMRHGTIIAVPLDVLQKLKVPLELQQPLHK